MCGRSSCAREYPGRRVVVAVTDARAAGCIHLREDGNGGQSPWLGKRSVPVRLIYPAGSFKLLNAPGPRVPGGPCMIPDRGSGESRDVYALVLIMSEVFWL